MIANDYYNLERAFKQYLRESELAVKSKIAQRELERIFKDHIDVFLAEKGLPESDRDKYIPGVKDGVFILSPVFEGGKKKSGLSERKVEFVNDYLRIRGCQGEELAEKDADYLYSALKSYIYKGNCKKQSIVPGTYLMRRLSFNRSFPGQVVSIRVWIWEDVASNGDEILRYQTVNYYPQDLLGKDKPYQRLRMSKGYILPNQYNSIMIGSTDYSHLSDVEGKSHNNNYPEIISINTAADAPEYLGLVLANYPDYRKPVCVQCVLNRVADQDRMAYFKDEGWVNDEHIGVRDPLEDEQKYIINRVDQAIQMMIPNYTI